MNQTVPLLDGVHAVVTGGASGIGAAIVRKMSEAGASVAAWDVKPPEASTFSGLDRAVEFVEADITDPQSVSAALEATESLIGPVHSLINNAGVTRDRLVRDMSFDEWDTVLNVNLKGAFVTTKIVTPGMVERKSGTIVNISSLGGKVGTVGQANYCASKAGLVGLTKSTAKEFARFGIRVNAIQPGLIDTPMTAALRPDIYDKKLQEVPLRRAGRPDEIGDGCVFLASNMSSYITGVVLEIGGGRNI
ncbi:3-oxoacyl-[acyl-carrier protein] reductase [Rhodococcus wratislaviensis]|uniref:3-oxoacyl-[acyl-carrier protein] reductase n=1 Tax=Rhodococcus wratislaviensis TaxID=44752 RepID=A0A402CF19_RHOWR|nr:3-oxoacyl-ACP reductase FabG [Rhodococcus wratislaviensis]GCE42139.1 3-oxoacyl-[acyl-carrier protein] reductase [Rhodococcus wratislaviensis]